MLKYIIRRDSLSPTFPDRRLYTIEMSANLLVEVFPVVLGH